MNEYPGDFSRALLLHNGKRKRFFFVSDEANERVQICWSLRHKPRTWLSGVHSPSVRPQFQQKQVKCLWVIYSDDDGTRDKNKKPAHSAQPPPEHCRVIIVKYRVPVILPSKRYPIKTRVHFLMSEQLAALQVNFSAALRDEMF